MPEWDDGADGRDIDLHASSQATPQKSRQAQLKGQVVRVNAVLPFDSMTSDSWPSTPTDVVRALVASFNERAPIDVALFFTPDFQLDDPGAAAWRSGHAGARDMLDALLALGPDARLEILDMIEQGDRVAVRWQLTIGGAETSSFAMMAMYRFVAGRIAEDWGVSVRAPWQR